MKLLHHILLTALLAGLFVSCIKDQETQLEIYQKDLKKIEDYLATTDYQYIKKEQDASTGIVMLWDSLSYSGVKANGADTLKVNYVGRLLDETVFDTNIEAVARENGMYNSDRNYAPLEVYNQKYLPGFLIALSKMEKGDRARVLIPSLYAYGNREYQGRIPANAVLIFDLDLRDVIKNEEETTTEE
ncbi:FKBP-type peptidyl-prolyl cis-trans isomerase [Echinicola soli]|uniref:Peptidyl-prolyl cis-trans isomerase n=1 Tax=Echinicola soli TaxID=2591634 RepID=A0A514CFM1_9BACT|nr:FKBP-type peptidyl-prolyl cis-trans isomerase [Echinicola soli]QDH78606.1 FKBP-type peptidyl-prolyl cis-trans isomerase [Echinicola soli]